MRESAHALLPFSRSGLTLIELSIVLVIISLLAGGVTIGKEMIQAAHIRKIGRMVEEVDAAVSAFKVKYNCLPGDCANATQFGFYSNGNGNANVYQTDGAANRNGGTENIQFFKMLIDSGMLTDRRYCTLHRTTCAIDGGGYTAYLTLWGLDVPLRGGAAETGAMGIINTAGINETSTTTYKFPFSHMYLFSSRSHVSYSQFSAGIASQLDRKFDDGLPLTGTILALGPNGADVQDDTWFRSNGLGCMNRTTTPYSYQTGTTANPGCTLTWRAGF